MCCKQESFIDIDTRGILVTVRLIQVDCCILAFSVKSSGILYVLISKWFEIDIKYFLLYFKYICLLCTCTSSTFLGSTFTST